MDKMKNRMSAADLAGTMFAGSMAGVSQITVTYPLKFVKVQMQLEEKFGKERLYKGMADCMYKTYRSHGVLGLYRGLNIFLYASRATVAFGTYETLKSRFSDSNGVLTPTNRFLCGLIAGGMEAAVINTPLETVECKLIHDRRLEKSRFKGFVHATGIIYREEGIKSFYNGLWPAVLKQGTNQGIRFFIVETLKGFYGSGDPSAPVPKLMVGVFGLIAGFCSVVVTNPIDVVKTRMQSLNYKRYRNMIHCFFKVCKEEGFYSFYRGLSPRLSRVCVEVALTFMVYDIIKSMKAS